MKLITVTAVRAIKLKAYVASQGQEMLVDLAVGAYGYLLRSGPPREYSLAEFADVIARHYDVRDNARNQAVVDALRVVQEQTETMAELHVEPAVA